jgi:hypothetical protein
MKRETHILPSRPAARMPARPVPARSPRARRALATATLAVALAWLLVGCCGLLWTIAFTSDARSMTIGLVVWVFCFVVPSTLATAFAYRVEEQAPRAPTDPSRGRGSTAAASAGD